jgi:stringent starvation protein B
MTSSRPYLVRAIYDWILDNQLTPHLVVDAGQAGVSVPAAAVRDGQVILNIAPRAVAHLELGNDQVHFLARFGGVSHEVRLPISAVLAVYAQENGQGMMFPSEPREAGQGASDPQVTTLQPVATTPAPVLSSVPSSEPQGDGEPDPNPPGKRTRPALRVVK